MQKKSSFFFILWIPVWGNAYKSVTVFGQPDQSTYSNNYEDTLEPIK